MESEYVVIDYKGQAHAEPWGENRKFEYGAPLDFRRLFQQGDPETGTA